jgi:hypothetical protein
MEKREFMHPSTFLATYLKELHVECGHFSGNQKNQKKLKLLFKKNNSSVWEKRAKKSQLMKIHPSKKMMILGLFMITGCILGTLNPKPNSL